jgi:hypothetical protein
MLALALAAQQGWPSAMNHYEGLLLGCVFGSMSQYLMGHKQGWKGESHQNRTPRFS